MPAAVALAGFLGSAHCAGMCGPLILGLARNHRELACYHAARLASYALAGVAAGYLGSAVELRAPSWLTMATMAFFAIVLIATGVVQAAGWKIHFDMPLPASSPLRKARARALSLRSRLPHLAAAMAGALSVFLPCGHLYAFLAAGVSTGSAFKGGILMASFAAGTLPALGFGLALAQKALSPALRLRLAGALLIGAGLMSLAAFAADWRGQLGSAQAERASPSSRLRCH